VPVLAFHGVLPDADASPFNATGKFISPARLRTFLESASRIFRMVSVDEFIDSALAGRRLRNAMVLTFDDGYANAYDYAFPLLRQLGMPFAVFVTTGLIDTDGVLWNDLLEFAVQTTRKSVFRADVLPGQVAIETRADRLSAIARLKNELKTRNLDEAWTCVKSLCDELDVDTDSPELDKVRFIRREQIREMSEAGVVFGGHTVTHPILSKESQDRVRSEVTDCKRLLEGITGKQVWHFAYPNGRREDFNDMVKRELRLAGYASSFASIRGPHRPGDDLLEIRRIAVLNHWTYAEFETRCSGILTAIRR
jgi:peptidoglycan/xylan/chitin deacetylase (PgdA/CDA1 family)